MNKMFHIPTGFKGGGVRNPCSGRAEMAGGDLRQQKGRRSAGAFDLVKPGASPASGAASGGQNQHAGADKPTPQTVKKQVLIDLLLPFWKYKHESH